MAVGGPGAIDAQRRLSTEVLPLLLGDEEEGSSDGAAATAIRVGGASASTTVAASTNGRPERLTLGSFAERVCTVFDLRSQTPPPEELEDVSAGGGGAQDRGEVVAPGVDGVTVVPHAAAGSFAEEKYLPVAGDNRHQGLSSPFDLLTGNGSVNSISNGPTGPTGTINETTTSMNGHLTAAAGGVLDEGASSAAPTTTPMPVEGPALSSSFRNTASEAANNNEARDPCVDWLFGPRQDAWLAAEKRNTSTVAAAGAAWRAVDAVLSRATVVVASRASRGTEHSSVWARPDGLVWAKQAKNFYWPAMLLWRSGTNSALRELNVGRVPPAFREELEKQVLVSFPFFYCFFFFLERTLIYEAF